MNPNHAAAYTAPLQYSCNNAPPGTISQALYDCDSPQDTLEPAGGKHATSTMIPVGSHTCPHHDSKVNLAKSPAHVSWVPHSP